EMVQLTDQWFDFDLLADGSNQGLLITEKGSGYLAFDKNQSGQIDDGNELFGPNTNNGFAELALYDEDGNGWIDENDSIFSQLGVLSCEDGEAVLTNAKDAGLGAIYLGYADANYEVLNKKGETQGVIRGNGVALTEEGQVLLVQEVHLRLQHPNTK